MIESVILLLLLLLRVLVVLAGVLSVHLAFHELLGRSQLATLPVTVVVAGAFFVLRFVLAVLLVYTAHIGVASLLSSRFSGLPLSALELIKEVLSIGILPLALLEVVRHPQGHIEVPLQFAVLTLLQAHLVDDHGTQERVMLLYALCLNVVGVLEVGGLEVQAGTGCH